MSNDRPFSLLSCRQLTAEAKAFEDKGGLTERAASTYKRAIHDDVVSLPLPQKKIVIAVYKLRDQTGQYKTSSPATPGWPCSATAGRAGPLRPDDDLPAPRVHAEWTGPEIHVGQQIRSLSRGGFRDLPLRPNRRPLDKRPNLRSEAACHLPLSETAWRYQGCWFTTRV